MSIRTHKKSAIRGSLLMPMTVANFYMTCKLLSYLIPNHVFPYTKLNTAVLKKIKNIFTKIYILYPIFIFFIQNLYFLSKIYTFDPKFIRLIQNLYFHRTFVIFNNFIFLSKLITFRTVSLLYFKDIDVDI